MHDMRKIWNCARSDFILWITDSRMVMIPVLLIFNYMLAIQPLIMRAKNMNTKINFLEPFIAMANSKTILLIMPFVFYILSSSFPIQSGNALLKIHRIGKKNWLLAQILLLEMMILIFLFITILGTIIPSLPYCYLSSDWSNVVIQDGLEGSIAAYVLLPENLFYQLSNAGIAFFWTFVLVNLYLFLLGMLLLFGTLLHLRKLANTVVGFLITGGAAICLLRSKWMWLFPMAHSITYQHFTKYWRKTVVPLEISVLYNIILIGILFIGCATAMQQYRFDSVQEE